jgi:hypothetical protein
VDKYCALTIAKKSPLMKNILQIPEYKGKEPSIEQTDLVSLVKHQERVEASIKLEQVYQQFQTHKHDFCAVTDAGDVVGLCSRGHLGFLLGHRFGFSILGKQPVRR